MTKKVKVGIACTTKIHSSFPGYSLNSSENTPTGRRRIKNRRAQKQRLKDVIAAIKKREATED